MNFSLLLICLGYTVYSFYFRSIPIINALCCICIIIDVRTAPSIGYESWRHFTLYLIITQWQTELYKTCILRWAACLRRSAVLTARNSSLAFHRRPPLIPYIRVGVSGYASLSVCVCVSLSLSLCGCGCLLGKCVLPKRINRSNGR